MQWRRNTVTLQAMNKKIPDSLCLLPWIHFRLGQTGEITPCCRIEEAYSYGNVKHDSLDEIWNGSRIKSFRESMLKGEKPVACRGCFQLEELGHESQRQVMNKQFEKAYSRLTEVHVPNPLYLDVRLSNTCNLSCRSCNPENSTSWYADAKAVNSPYPKGTVKPFKDVREQKEFFEKVLPTLTTLYFAGGEPLLDPGHYELLEMIITAGRTDIVLDYNSNFSSLTLKQWDIVELWKKFPNITVSASLDGVGPQAELLRKGLVWQKVVDNFHRVKKEVPHLRFWVYPTVSAMNAFHLPHAVKTFLAEGMITTPESFLVNIASTPAYLNLRIFNQDEKNLLSRHYQLSLQEISQIVKGELFNRIEKELTKVLHFLDGEDCSSERQNFRRFTFGLDKLRSEKFVHIFPELTGLLYEG